MKKTFSLLVAALLLLSVAAFAQQGSKGSQDTDAGQDAEAGQEDSSEDTSGKDDTAGDTPGKDASAASDEEPAGSGIGQAEQTGNQGEDTMLQNKVAVKAGSFTTEGGKQLQVQEQAGSRIQLKAGEVSAQTSMQMTQEQTQAGTKLHVKLSNGQDAEVKVMPDTASEKALERLRVKVCTEENNCQIELKEVGQGEQVKAAYEVKVQKQAKLLGLFRTKMQVQAQVDAENGEVLQEKKPWWAFLASDAE